MISKGCERTDPAMRSLTAGRKDPCRRRFWRFYFLLQHGRRILQAALIPEGVQAALDLQR